MKRKQIRDQVRVDLDDTKKPYLWSDDFLNASIDRAQDEAARRARLIVDSSESEVTRITLTAGESDYPLDPRVIFVRRVRYVRTSDGLTRLLRKKRQQDLDHERGARWEEETGEITHFCLDRRTGFLVPYRLPIVDSLGTLELTVVRTPLKGLANDEASPEFAPRWHSPLRHFVEFEAYMVPDEDKYRPDKAKVADALFTREFGPPSSAQDERWINDHHGYDAEEGIY